MMEDTFLTKEEKKALKKEKEGKRDQKISRFLIVLMFGGCSIWFLLSGIYGLFFADHSPVAEVFSSAEKNDIYEGDATYYAMGTWCTMSHTINGIIPIGKEYYYLIFSEDKSSVISVRAGKHWADGFDSGTYNSVFVKGQVKTLDYQEKNRLIELIDYAPDYLADSVVNTEYYVDLLSGRLNVMQVLAGAGLLFVIIYFYLMARRPKEEQTDTGIFKPVYLTAIAILAAVVFGLVIHVLCYI